MQHKMSITELYHSRTGFSTTLIVLTIPAIPAMPGVRPLKHPGWLQRYEATRARRTRLPLYAPPRTMLGHPGVQRMVVILLIGKDRDETWIGPRCDEAEQGWGCHPIIEASTGNEHGEQPSPRIDQQMALTPLHFLAAIIAALRASHRGGLDRLTVDARGTRGGFAPCCHAGPLAQGRAHLVPGPVVAPRGKVVIHGAL